MMRVGLDGSNEQVMNGINVLREITEQKEVGQHGASFGGKIYLLGN